MLTGDPRTDRALVTLARLCWEVAQNPPAQDVTAENGRDAPLDAETKKGEDNGSPGTSSYEAPTAASLARRRRRSG